MKDYLSKFPHLRNRILIVPIMLAITACSSGGDSNGGGGNGGGTNFTPIANAGADRTVAELTVTQLMGSGTDANAGDTLTFSWTQTAGVTVAISNGNAAQASFTAPDVTAGSPEMLTFQLTVSDGTASHTDTVVITVTEPGSSVTISGVVNYEFVPPNLSCQGLNFTAIETRPIRGVPVQLMNSTGTSVIASTVSNDTGDYSFSNVDANTMVRLRVRAELKKSGSPSWDVEVRDNYDASAVPPALGTRPLYVVDGSNFDTGSTDVTRNLTATTGWGVTSYTGARSAAPFAILDTIYSGIQFIVSADPTATFAPLDTFWSVNNTATINDNTDLGELGGSFYSSGIDSLFLVGDASDDTEEFDDHVILHEWGHYFEDNFSRSDSIGGAHGIGQRIDPRLAFGEGWATALAAMALNNQLYCDTGTPGTTAGFGIGAESGSYNAQGWYDEVSVLRFIYDLWDSNDEGGDAGSIGFAPIYDVMRGPQSFTDAFTTVFSFAAELRASLPPSGQTLLDAQLAREDMTAAGLDIWGSNELNDAGGAPDVIPIYREIIADGTVYTDVCSNSQFDSGRTGNKLSEDRFLRITIPVTDQYDVVVATTTATPPTADVDDRDQSDPDIYIYQGPTFITAGTSATDNLETLRTPVLTQGQIYIASVEDWRFDDDEASPTYPERICFDISFSPTP